MPAVSDDDVVDFMVMEALAAKEALAEQKAEKRQRQKAWLKDHKQLGKFS